MPRIRASSCRQEQPRTRRQKRRAKVAEIAESFEGTGSLVRYIYDELTLNDPGEASMETIRKDLKALEAEGKIPNR